MVRCLPTPGIAQARRAGPAGSRTHGWRSLQLAPRGCRPRRLLQILEEVPVGAHHQQVTILAERALVSLQTAVESVELGILRVGARIDLGGGAKIGRASCRERGECAE